MIDGNVLAGTMGDLLSSDLTNARARCAACGRVGAIGETMVFDHSAGVVARCPGCEEVLITVVRAETRTFVSFRGLSFLEFAH